MKAILTLEKSEIETLYYMLSYVLENGFEFIEEDSWMNQPFKRAFDKIINAYEDMQTSKERLK